MNLVNLENQLTKFHLEVDVLRDANKATLSLVRDAQRQRELLEDKYNSYLEELDDGEMVLKKKIKSKDEENKSL